MANETRLQRRKRRVAHRVFSNTSRDYVISIRKTSRYIYAQLDSVKEGKTLAGLSSRAIEKKKYNKVIAQKFGVKFGEMMKEKCKDAMLVVLNRGSMAYHGCVKEFAEGVRSAGLKF